MLDPHAFDLPSFMQQKNIICMPAPVWHKQLNFNLPSNFGLILGVDYGEKKIGFALGQTITHQATPLDILHYQTRLERFSGLAHIFNTHQPQLVCLGLPLYADGGAHLTTKQAIHFGLDLHRYFAKPIVWVDERYTSVCVRHSHGPKDAISASLIAQSFLDYPQQAYWVFTR